MKKTTTFISLIFFSPALVLNMLKNFFERSRKPFNTFRASAGIILCIFISFSSTNYGLIIESDHLSSVLEHIGPRNTLVIFDIDNTLAHPTEELSSDEWFCYLVDKKMAEGFDYITSVYYALPAAYYAQFNIPLEPTEPHIPDLIARLVNNGIAVMALSSRSLFIAERSLDQLNNINITFFVPNVNPQDLVLPMPYPCFYKDGILFSDNNDKGEALNCFFDIMNYHPEKVIFIDDKMKYILSVEKALQTHHIPFVGIRYSGCDERVKNFNPAKSESQWHALKQKNK